MLQTNLFFNLISLVVSLAVVAVGESEFYRTNYVHDRDVMVHLFEWRWKDIASECETFLAPMGYAGVQVSPPSENAVVNDGKIVRPWYERYQPVSYNLETRSGNEDDFRDMVERCNNVGVRIYVDAVINHMTGSQPEGTLGTGGSTFDSKTLSYPAVPYTAEDFNPEDTSNLDAVHKQRDGQLVGLKDLNQHRPEVREKIKGYLNHLLSLGVAGFRIDAAKHMWPEDLQEIYKDLYLSTDFFPPQSRPYIVQEVISLSSDDYDRKEYTDLAPVTEFRYGEKLAGVFRGYDKLRWLGNFGEAWNFVASKDGLAFVDNHDNQRSGDGNVLSYHEPELYIKALSFLMAWNYGTKRIMSSFRWTRNFQDNTDVNSWVGPPHDEDYNTLPVTIGSDGSCEDGWVCEHRWPSVARLVRFSALTKHEPVLHWWDNENNQIAFSKGKKGFYAVNNDDKVLDAELQTALPPGRYCDVITGQIDNGKCSGRIITVKYGGKVKINLATSGENSMLAIHTKAMVEEFDFKYPLEMYNAYSNVDNWHKTVIFMYKNTKTDSWIKLEGGVNTNLRQVCYDDPNQCSIPINLDGNPDEDKDVLRWSEASSLTTMHWTTNNSSYTAYNKINKYGPNYWMVEVWMDCSKTFYGWFDVKAVTPNGAVESDVSQSKQCRGNFHVETPYQSSNHIAMCGKVNVFRYGSPDCIIDDFDN